MRLKCWRCGKRRQIFDGKERRRTLLSRFISFDVVIALPNPICKLCFDDFVKWSLDGVQK